MGDWRIACLFVVVDGQWLMQRRSPEKSFGKALQPAVAGKREEGDEGPWETVIREAGPEGGARTGGEGGAVFQAMLRREQMRALRLPEVPENPAMVAYVIELTDAEADLYVPEPGESAGKVFLTDEDALATRDLVKADHKKGVPDDAQYMFDDQRAVLLRLVRKEWARAPE